MYKQLSKCLLHSCIFSPVLKFNAGQIRMDLWDRSGKNVGLQLIQTVFDIIPITRYIITHVLLTVKFLHLGSSIHRALKRTVISISFGTITVFALMLLLYGCMKIYRRKKLCEMLMLCCIMYGAYIGLSELLLRVCSQSGDSRVGLYLFHHISVMIQCFNSILLHNILTVYMPDL